MVGRNGHLKSSRICIAHVLGREYDHSPGDEPRILARVEHSSQPVDGRVRIGTAHRLDERRDHVVMPVATFVVWEGAPLQGLLRSIQIYLPAGCRHKCGSFERVESSTRIAPRAVGDVCERIGMSFYAKPAEPALRVVEGP